MPRAERCPFCLDFLSLLQISQGTQVSPGVGKGLQCGQEATGKGNLLISTWRSAN